MSELAERLADIALECSPALDACRQSEAPAVRAACFEAALRRVGSMAAQAADAAGNIPMRSAVEWAEPLAA